jgi:lysine N6-hydroxylase
MIYDLLGIGIGPFNLGLAALSKDIPKLTTCFIDERPGFNWHPGLLLPGARLQVPFYADLVTLVQPTSRYSWFSFLQAKQRLFRFGVQDNPFPLRREYNEYGQWVAAQLRHLHWGKRCVSVSYNDCLRVYGVHVLDIKTGMRETFHAKHLVIGIGSAPYWPTCVETFKPGQPPAIFHAADYLFNKPRLASAKHITIIGSGQSAAEIFQDVLNALIPLSWITRSPRFFPMEATPAAFEMSSPDYRRHFYNLPPAMKEFILAGQDALYKGINSNLLSSIYQQLYERSLVDPARDVSLLPNCELVDVQQKDLSTALLKSGTMDLLALTCQFRHREAGDTFEHHTDVLILATGYAPQPANFLAPINNRINYLPNGKFDLSRHYSVTVDNTIFVQNADLHSHGFASADLSFGPYRNAIILNTILGADHFKLETHTAFQRFRAPGPI